MSSRSCSRVVLSAVATLGLSFVSCSDSPSRPSPIPSSPANSTVRLELVAPQEVALGESVQLTANAVKSDGRVENVTTQTQWTVQSSSTGAVLSLTTPGLVTGIDVGRGSLTAQFGSFTADATIVVRPTPSEDFRGVYTLTVAGGDCRDGFPEHAKVRVYSAAISQMGTRLRVSLSGANFPIGGSAFEGVVTGPGEVLFEIRLVSIWDYDGPDIFERLVDGIEILIGGRVLARGTPTGLLGKAYGSGGTEGYMRLNGPFGTCAIRQFDFVRPMNP
jgi:hypothetical protein